MVSRPAWQHDRRSRHARGYGTAWDKLRIQVMTRDKGICQPCKSKGLVHAGTEVDHIRPKAAGGTDAMENLQAICTEAHKRKTVQENGGEWQPKTVTGADGWPTTPP